MQLYKLIYDRQYDEAEELLQEELGKRKLERYEFYILNMLHSYLKVRNGHDLIVRKEYFNDIDPYKKVFEALKNRDYYYAKELLTTINENKNCKLEFQLYLFIVDDIVEMLEQRNKKSQVEVLSDQLKDALFSINGIATTEEVYELLDINEELMYYQEQAGIENWYNYKIRDILNMIIQTKNESLTKDYFGKTSTETDPVEQLFDSLATGDYVTADYLINREFNKYAKSFSDYNIRQIMRIGRVLNLLMNELDNNKFRHTELIDAAITYLYFEECNQNIESVYSLIKDYQNESGRELKKNI